MNRVSWLHKEECSVLDAWQRSRFAGRSVCRAHALFRDTETFEFTKVCDNEVNIAWILFPTYSIAWLVGLWELLDRHRCSIARVIKFPAKRTWFGFLHGLPQFLPVFLFREVVKRSSNLEVVNVLDGSQRSFSSSLFVILVISILDRNEKQRQHLQELLKYFNK